MTYWQAVRESFWDFMGTWREVPKHAIHICATLAGVAMAICALWILLIGPFLAPLAPLWAFLWMKAHRDEERSIAEAQRKIDEHYGHLHQRVKK